MMAPRSWPSARAANVSAMRCFRIGSASASTSSTDGARRPSISALARTASISAWLARGPGPQATKRSVSSLTPVPGRAERTSFRIDVDDLVGDGDLAHEALDAHQLGAGEHGVEVALVGAGRGEQHAPLGEHVGIGDVDLQQEAVELRFGKRIGAFVLERVLRREHVERRRDVVARAGDGDVVLLHRLQQRRLRARRGAVDLVGHQQLGEDRTLDEAEGARLARRVLQHLGADDVGGHEVGRELHALGVEAEHAAERLDEQRLGEAGNADQQRVAAGQDGDQRSLDDDVLAEDDRGGRLVRPLHPLGGRLEAGDDVGVRVGEGAHGDWGSLFVSGGEDTRGRRSLTKL